MTPQEIQDEIALIAQQDSKGWRLWLYLLGRFVTRCARIGAGLAVLAGVLFMLGKAWDILNTPFAGQSFLGLLGGIALACGAFWLLAVAFTVAFGEGPTLEDRSSSQYERATNRIMARERSQSQMAWVRSLFSRR